MPLRVWLDTSPLKSGHAHRGIGAYTRFLLAALQAQATKLDLEILTEKPEIEPDVIHYPFFDLFFATLPLPKKVPVVVTVHDVIPLVFPQEYRPGVKGTVRFWQQRSRLQKVSAIVTDSECSRQDIEKHLNISQEKIWAVPLAANPELTSVSEYLQRKHAEEVGAPDDYIVYIGDINYNKNLPTLLLALTQLPAEIQLAVVSRTFSNTSIPEGKRLAEMIRENDLEERVHVLDIPGDQPEVLSAIIERARCLIQPSLYEGFGLPVLEAMQVGTVVVAANTSSLPEVAGDAAILVEPTVGGLAAGIEKAWHLRGETRAEFIQAGQARAAAFSWQQTAERTAQVYRAAYQKSQEEAKT